MEETYLSLFIVGGIILAAGFWAQGIVDILKDPLGFFEVFCEVAKLIWREVLLI